MMSVTPSRFTSELTSRCVYGILTGMNSKLVTFIFEYAIIFASDAGRAFSNQCIQVRQAPRVSVSHSW
jgi:hypothetical protein